MINIKPIMPAIYAGLTAGSLVIMSYACNKDRMDMDFGTGIGNPPGKFEMLSTDPMPFKATVGAPVDAKIGMEWIANYQAANGGKGKEYLIPAKELQQILKDSSCVGICLYFAIDDNQQPHLLPVGVNSKGYVMKREAINTLKGQINWETAQTWMANDGGAIDARFFGRNTFSRLFNTPNCETVRAICAMDEEQQPQLLLGNAALNYAMGGNTAYRFEDASFPCPPVCPLSD